MVENPLTKSHGDPRPEQLVFSLLWVADRKMKWYLSCARYVKWEEQNSNYNTQFHVTDPKESK